MTPVPCMFVRVSLVGDAKLLLESFACTRFLCNHKSLVHAQDSCACTRLVVHAQESFECTRIFCVHKNFVYAQDSCACARFLCMHAQELSCMHMCRMHAQDSCACTRLLCIHKNLVHAQECWPMWFIRCCV